METFGSIAFAETATQTQSGAIPKPVAVPQSSAAQHPPAAAPQLPIKPTFFPDQPPANPIMVSRFGVRWDRLTGTIYPQPPIDLQTDAAQPYAQQQIPNNYRFLSQQQGQDTDPGVVQTIDRDTRGWIDKQIALHQAQLVLFNIEANAAKQKKIVVDIPSQTLRAFEGYDLISQIKVSTARTGFQTPTGEYSISKKFDVHDYKGVDYDYRQIKWNMMFLPHKGGNYYIHGAPWNHHFGTPQSHGCVNVSYSNIPALYNWADLGTKVYIQSTQPIQIIEAKPGSEPF